MSTQTTITATGHNFQPGDYITLTVPDRRWWRRLLYWMLRRGTPYREVTLKVAAVAGSTVEVKP